MRLIELAFEEDFGGRGDITGAAVGIGNESASAAVIAKQEGVVCGVDVVRWVFAEANENIRVETTVRDGERVHSRQTLISLNGSARALLAAERTALNFLGRLSGIATLTNRFVQAVAGTRCRILDTRKTAAGWRLLDKYAVRCGGGQNHRTGLYDMFLIKENHIAAAGGITEAVTRCRNYMARLGFDAQIEVETRTLNEVEETLRLNVDRIMLDNMSLEMMRAAVALVKGAVELEASGNVRLENVRAVAETGVDFVSVGALTHSVPVFDVSLLFADQSA